MGGDDQSAPPTNPASTSKRRRTGASGIGERRNRTKVSGAGLVNLKGLTKLRILWLHNTKVTDAGLVNLVGLTKLQILWLRDTKVTAAGVKKLKAALPKCKITR